MFDIGFVPSDVRELPYDLGVGQYSSVKLGIYCGREVALKIFNSSDDNAMAEALNEVSIYSRLVNQPHIIECYGVYFKGKTPVIVMENAGKSLLNVFREEKGKQYKLSFAVIKSRALQICYGVKSLHDQKISHGDLSCKNIVVSDGGILKICDMGFARFVENGTFHDNRGCCTLYAAAPEFLSTGCRSLSTDIYSLAMVLLELTIGDFAYTFSDLLSCTVNGVVDTERFKSDVQFGKRPSIPSEVPAHYADIIRSCWVEETEEKKRPTIDEVITRLKAWNVN